MHDSWIDRDEFDELVGAFSKKKKPSRKKGSRRTAQPENDAAPAEKSSEEEPVLNAEVKEKDRSRKEVKQKKSGKKTRKAWEAKAEKVAKPRKKKKNPAKSKKGSAKLKTKAEPESLEEDLEPLPGIDFEEQIAREEDEGESLDAIAFLKQEGASEEEPFAEEEPLAEKEPVAEEEPADSVLTSDSSEVLTTVTVEETTSSADEDRSSLVLGDAGDLLENQSRIESERDAEKAVLALAEARKMAERNHLIKERKLRSKEDEELLELLGISTEPAEEAPAEAPTISYEFRPEGNLPQRLAAFAECADNCDEVRGVTVFDRDGYLLYAGANQDRVEANGAGTFLARASDSFCQQSIPGEISATQVTAGGGEWRCLIAGSGEASRVLAEFRVDRPLEAAEVEAWSKALADAVIPANDLP
ncbi:MAG: hypothetical protein VXX36_07720 [Verrucomicrobiota bacterium]|nr:hypothetical protein [Verrucomicrobiota bacterium]